MLAQHSTKTCLDCNTEKPVSDFPVNRSRGKAHIRNYCKPCFNNRHRKPKTAVDKIPDPDITESTCKLCGEIKPISDFRVRKDTRRAKAYVDARCWPCIRATTASFSAKAKRAQRKRAAKRQGREYFPAGDPIAARNRRLSRIPSEPTDELLERNARDAWQYWFKHMASDECVAAYYRDKPWNNPRLSAAEGWRVRYQLDADFRAHEIKRAADKKKKIRRATPPWADQSAIADIYRSASAMQQATGVEYEVDHVVPLCGRKVCGLHVEYNLQVIPRDANRDKRNTFSEGWHCLWPRR